MEQLPPTVTTARLVLRRWRLDDAPALSAAITRSLDHLRPWMWWVANEPLDVEGRTELLRSMERDWAAGGDATYGVFEDGEVVGGCGLHRRRGPGVLEIGYWIHVDHVGRGLATELAAALTAAAFTVDGIERVEIHHDRANVRSRAVPARLGFTLVGERPNGRHAPGEEGVDCVWSVARPDWLGRVRRVARTRPGATPGPVP